MAAAVAGMLVLLAGRYGFHRDELYFLAAGRHPAWGYADQPPLTPLLGRASAALFGAGPTGLRVLPALITAACTALVSLTARELGAGRRGQLLAACAAAGSAFVLATGHMLLTSTFDLLAWLAVSLLALRLLRTGDGRWWPAIGAAAGVALLNKDLVLLLVGTVVPAVSAVGPRRALRGRWPLAGLLVAVGIALPNLWWQAAHGWPELTVAGGISDQDGPENRLMFVPMQLLYLSPVLVPVWVEGIRRLLRDPGLRWARGIAVAYPALCLVVVVAGGKPYYAMPLLLVLTAAGCEPTVRRLSGAGGAGASEPAGAGMSTGPGAPKGPGRRWIRFAAWLAFGAAVNVVITLPVLPPRLLPAVTWIYREQAEQVGWPELAAAVTEGWAAVPPERRDRAVVLASNYGEAGALAEYGPRLGLPGPYSGHMSFADWGPPDDAHDGPVVLVHPDGHAGVEAYFTDCRVVARVDNGHGVRNQEQHAPVLLCSGPTAPWSVLWPRLRHFY
ncbi:glycosyltransferase family 39 protein [Kitasatospora sp. CM 4170]|uniref:Glycosyltransferase family 39 protein n=1 Tax=Kitasatospora aburaviensis TaxID=67265 RepID=A0ABW1ERV7_9ACTN|nr:glycosyltransferase family 39 protein [Kitasatospora sp. CM 4170]WNM48416.1 glycosyltransferase family 39 protein [Kitasatospora sp. CM 4170]